nr:ubiquitin-like protein Pup [Propionibacterium sp.]
MSERIQRRRSRGAEQSGPAEEQPVTPVRPVDYDALLAEIDEVLQGDAEEYVRSFVQKGGQ